MLARGDSTVRLLRHCAVNFLQCVRELDCKRDVGLYVAWRGVQPKIVAVEIGGVDGDTRSAMDHEKTTPRGSSPFRFFLKHNPEGEMIATIRVTQEATPQGALRDSDGMIPE